MKKRMKHLFTLGLSLLMLVSLVGCGGESAQVADTNPDTPVEEVTFPLKEKKELSFITSAPATSTQDPNERLIFQRIEKQTNVEIDWTCFVADQFADKKNLALAQFGSLPDGLFTAGMNDYDLLRYAKQGIIIPLENLIDKYMPNLQAVFEKYPEYRTMVLLRTDIFTPSRGLNSWEKEKKQFRQSVTFHTLIKNGWIALDLRCRLQQKNWSRY